MKILHVIINSKWHNVIMNETVPKELHPKIQLQIFSFFLFLHNLLARITLLDD